VTSVPRFDRSTPPYRDDPVIAALTDEQLAAFLDVIVRLARSKAAAELSRHADAKRRAAAQQTAAEDDQ
jgi:hypothetical protein